MEKDLLKKALHAFNMIPNTKFFYENRKTSTYDLASEIEQYLRDSVKEKTDK